MREERKWRKPTNPSGVPVWSHGGIICTGEVYKNVVKLTFANRASLRDPWHLFNASLDGNARRAIDIHEGEEVDAAAFKALVRAAVAANRPPAPAGYSGTPTARKLGTKPGFTVTVLDAPRGRR